MRIIRFASVLFIAIFLGSFTAVGASTYRLGHAMSCRSGYSKHTEGTRPHRYIACVQNAPVAPTPQPVLPVSPIWPTVLPFMSVANYGDYGNLTTADCTLAAAADLLQLQEHSGEFATQPIVDEWNQLVATYPDTMQSDIFNTLETTGIAGTGRIVTSVTPVAYGPTGFPVGTPGGPTNPSQWINQANIEAGINQYDGLYAIIILPQAISLDESIGGFGVPLPQFNAFDQSSNRISTPWTVDNTVNSQTAGGYGHAVALVGYDASYVYLVSWGSVFAVTWSWIEANTYEVWGLTF